MRGLGKPFPRKTLLIGLASVPCYCVFFVYHGVKLRTAAIAGVFAAVVLLLVLTLVWWHVNRARSGP
jgi:hypothetical protein